MTNINKGVWEVLARDVCMQRDLNRKIINIRGLAKLIIKNHLPNASLDSVISAIRRFQTGGLPNAKDSEEVFHGAVVSTKNFLACVTLKRKAFRNLSKIMEADFDRKGVIRLIRAEKVSKAIVDLHNLDELLSIFPQSEVNKVEKDLAEVSININPKAEDTPGVLAKIVNEIAIHDININEVIICLPEVRIYVKQDDLLKVHKIVFDLIRKG
jgi:hypothetical protein